jgi:transcriptional regulator with XRE-family HTH domain
MERDDFVMLVARNLEAAMVRKGTNPSEVARNAGINPTGVYDIMSGKSRSPRLDTLQKIAVKGLGVSLASLFTNPADDQVMQELVETIGLMAAEDQKRILAMAHALVDSAKP